MADKPSVEVSSGNPCPMLRALVSEGYLPDAGAPIQTVSDVATQAKCGSPGCDPKFHKTVSTVALAANGLWPWDLVRNSRKGVNFRQLRGGPLDKKGAGSRILDSQAQVNLAELDRLGSFATPKTGADGVTEPGLDATEIDSMMDANFARAKGQRRPLDRQLMKGEFPVLLKVMGKDAPTGPYLSVAEVRTLFTHMRLPNRVRNQFEN
jgi:hypothetical protein